MCRGGCPGRIDKKRCSGAVGQSEGPRRATLMPHSQFPGFRAHNYSGRCRCPPERSSSGLGFVSRRPSSAACTTALPTPALSPPLIQAMNRNRTWPPTITLTQVGPVQFPLAATAIPTPTPPGTSLEAPSRMQPHARPPPPLSRTLHRQTSIPIRNWSLTIRTLPQAATLTPILTRTRSLTPGAARVLPLTHSPGHCSVLTLTRAPTRPLTPAPVMAPAPDLRPLLPVLPIQAPLRAQPHIRTPCPPSPPAGQPRGRLPWGRRTSPG